MSRYIDADALTNKNLDINIPQNVGAFDFMDIMDQVLKIIDAEPTVDAVPVVRCGECKYRIDVDGLSKSGYFCERCHYSFDMENCDDFFCADGERRSDD